MIALATGLVLGATAVGAAWVCTLAWRKARDAHAIVSECRATQQHDRARLDALEESVLEHNRALTILESRAGVSRQRAGRES